MITLLYTKDDYVAAEMALKIQAIGAGQGQKFYTVPKHYGRKDEQVYKNLDKSNIALLIAYENHQIDEQTAEEIRHLDSKNKKIVAIVPHDFQGLFLSKNIEPYKYTRTDQNSLLLAIQQYVNQLKQQPQSEENKDSGIFAAIMMLIVGLLLIAFITDDKK